MISRVTGQEKKYAGLIASTFVALCGLANFDAPPAEVAADPFDETHEDPEGPEEPQRAVRERDEKRTRSIAFRHNVEIHLPATTNISVYNAIYKNIRDHLLD